MRWAVVQQPEVRKVVGRHRPVAGKDYMRAVVEVEVVGRREELAGSVVVVVVVAVAAAVAIAAVHHIHSLRTTQTVQAVAAVVPRSDLAAAPTTEDCSLVLLPGVPVQLQLLPNTQSNLAGLVEAAEDLAEAVAEACMQLSAALRKGFWYS